LFDQHIFSYPERWGLILMKRWKSVEEWLKVLVAPGSLLGGARPKANPVDE